MNASRAPRAIVFAYHDVGVRGLRAVLDAGIEVPLVVTHADAPGETIFFASVAQTAAEHGLRCVAPDDADAPELIAEARAACGGRPDFLFSFYYRRMLRQPWLDLPTRGAFNLHGSLLPRYRGRAPVNWAVLHGERETGATLHVMNAKPDNGAIVDQCAVPILIDDRAHEVFAKVTVAAEIVLVRSLPKLVAGTASFTPQDLSQGGYFGGRRPEDGRLQPTASAAELHNLVRAVAPPYPGAFIDAGGTRVFIERTQHAIDLPPTIPGISGQGVRLFAADAALWLQGADGAVLRVLAARLDGEPLDAQGFARRFDAPSVAADA